MSHYEESHVKPSDVSILGRRVALRGTAADTPFLQAARGEWEPATFAALLEHVHPAVTYLDIGAHFGATLLFAASSARAAVGFEPDPVAFEELTARVATSPDSAKIVLVPKAVAALAGTARLNNRTRAGNSASSFYVPADAATWEVETVCLLDYLERENLKGQLFIKMDIEGAEYEVVPAIAPLLRGEAVSGFLLSLHPFLYLRGYLGAGDGLCAKLHARMTHLLVNARLFWALRHFSEWRDDSGRPIRAWRIAVGLLLGQVPVRGNSVLCLKKTGPPAVHRAPS